MKLSPLKRRKILPLQVIVHIGSWLPLLWLAWADLAGRLSVNPIQDAERYTGRYAITLLLLSLACTPLHTLFKWNSVLKVRRALGLYTFLYVAIHISILIGVDYAFAFDLLWADLARKAYIIVGFLTFLTLIPLAITSTKGWMKRLGKDWKRLHKLVYASGVLAVIHYAWAQKGDLFSLRGNILLPLIYGAILAILLVARIPPVRRRVSRIRDLFARGHSSPRVPASMYGFLKVKETTPHPVILSPVRRLRLSGTHDSDPANGSEGSQPLQERDPSAKERPKSLP